jgi:hypothetical protein
MTGVEKKSDSQASQPRRTKMARKKRKFSIVMVLSWRFGNCVRPKEKEKEMERGGGGEGFIY